MATEEAVSHEEEAGSLIGIVLASLVERVTALEQGRRPHVRPTILDPEDVRPVSRESIYAQVGDMFMGQQMSVARISRETGYTEKTIRTYLRKAGVMPAARKREIDPQREST